MQSCRRAAAVHSCVAGPNVRVVGRDLRAHVVWQAAGLHPPAAPHTLRSSYCQQAACRVVLQGALQLHADEAPVDAVHLATKQLAPLRTGAGVLQMSIMQFSTKADVQIDIRLPAYATPKVSHLQRLTDGADDEAEKHDACITKKSDGHLRWILFTPAAPHRCIIQPTCFSCCAADGCSMTAVMAPQMRASIAA